MWPLSLKSGVEKSLTLSALLLRAAKQKLLVGRGERGRRELNASVVVDFDVETRTSDGDGEKGSDGEGQLLMLQLLNVPAPVRGRIRRFKEPRRRAESCRAAGVAGPGLRV